MEEGGETAQETARKLGSIIFMNRSYYFLDEVVWGNLAHFKH